MSRNIPFPFFGTPPKEYQHRYFEKLVESFNIYVRQVANPGEGRNTFTVFTNLQANDVGLEPGAVFQVDGVLRVSLANMPYPSGVSGTSSVGSVTVSTP